MLQQDNEHGGKTGHDVHAGPHRQADGNGGQQPRGGGEAHGFLLVRPDNADAQETDGGDHTRGYPGGIHPHGVHHIGEAVFGKNHHQSRAGSDDHVGTQARPLAVALPFPADQGAAGHGGQNTQRIYEFLQHRKPPIRNLLILIYHILRKMTMERRRKPLPNLCGKPS